MKIAFASDFDRTLYFRDGFHKDDLNAIQKWQSEGNLFGVCTGRSLGGVLEPTEGRIHYDFFILATGSLILDRNQEPLYENSIPNTAVMEITKQYQDMYRIAYNCRENFHSLYDDYEICVVMKSLDELPKEVFGISFATPDTMTAHEICKILNQSFPVSAFNNGQFVDITAKGCSKGNALHILKEKMAIDEIHCMGDSYNDISMLENGDVSFTFDSSPELVRSKAKHILSSLKDALMFH
jgi:HAD superfamily hydrolase (TIGR01484 family)